MASENETVEKVLSEIYDAYETWKRSEVASLPTQYLKEWHDRIEAAAKREREAGAEAAQVCGEIGEMIGREATREKSSRVGNAEKMRDACANIAEYAKAASCHTDDSHLLGYLYQIERLAESALAAPPRNCDRPECATTKAAQDVWRKEDGGKTAYYEWLLAASTKGAKEGDSK